MEDVFIGLGSNQGDSICICSQAIEMLSRHPRIRLVKRSSFYLTEPVGVKDQEHFVNGVVLCRTDLRPEELLSVLQEIENMFHRVRFQRWGPRTLDLDLLFFGEQCIHNPRLSVPHPRLHQRRFVLAPMAEIAPKWRHPELGVTVEALLEGLPPQGQAVEKVRSP